VSLAGKDYFSYSLPWAAGIGRGNATVRINAMTTAAISASVGRNGMNHREDVFIVQNLLLARGYRIGTADGLCGDRTITAIVTFQSAFLSSPDGRVDPGGRTWRTLTAPGQGPTQPTPPETPSLSRPVPKPLASSMNPDLRAVNNAYMREKFGQPRDTFSTDCQPLTSERLRRNIVIESVGPFRVQGLRPAVSSLRAVMDEIARAQPEVCRVLGTAGMLCCRYVRGSTTAISNHSWGTAVDLKVNNVLDARGDNNVLYGLTLIAPIFNRFGWYWGAAFRTEDAMHFEGSRSLIDEWAAQLD
jgi:hypothetical protein